MCLYLRVCDQCIHYASFNTWPVSSVFQGICLCTVSHVCIDDILLIIYDVYLPSRALPVPMDYRAKYQDNYGK